MKQKKINAFFIIFNYHSYKKVHVSSQLWIYEIYLSFFFIPIPYSPLVRSFALLLCAVPCLSVLRVCFYNFSFLLSLSLYLSLISLLLFSSCIRNLGLRVSAGEMSPVFRSRLVWHVCCTLSHRFLFPSLTLWLLFIFKNEIYKRKEKKTSWHKYQLVVSTASLFIHSFNFSFLKWNLYFFFLFFQLFWPIQFVKKKVYRFSFPFVC